MGGSGLGLAIVKHIVNRHRGRLRITSNDGETCFSITLPCVMQSGTRFQAATAGKNIDLRCPETVIFV